MRILRGAWEKATQFGNWSVAHWRDLLGAWLLFWLCAIVVDFSGTWWTIALGVLQGFLTTLAPGTTWTFKDLEGSDGSKDNDLSWFALFLLTLRTALLWYFAVVLPIYVLIRTNRVRAALGPFHPETMENLIRVLRGRARTFNIWAVVAVVLIVGTLGAGFLAFGGPEYIMQPSPLNVGKDQPPPVFTVKQDTNSVITSVARRAGAIIILIFLVSVLVHMYRDNVKHSTFYERWADALQLAGTDPDKLKQFVDLFFLESIEFDKPPKTPVEQLARTLQGVQQQLEKKKP
jgi:hypothetical protein